MAGEIVKHEPGSIGAYQHMVEGRKASMEAVLPIHLRGRADSLVKSAMLAAMKNPQIQKCSPGTIASALIQAAQLGFTDVSGTLGHAYLVPYSGQCQLIVGYRGMLDLARRSGEIQSVEATPVFKGDVFKRTLGDNPSFIHEPGDADQTWENFQGAYCIAKFKDGGIHRSYMTKKEIDRIKKNTQVWREHPIQMALKTVVRRAFKWWPMSLDLQRDLTEMASRQDTKAAANDILDIEAVETEPTEEQPQSVGELTDGTKGIGSEDAQPPANLQLGEPVGRVKKETK